jgi:hypothetical protein
VRVRLEGAVEALRRDHDLEPEAAMAAPCPPLPEGVTAAGRARDLEREVRLLGPINRSATASWRPSWRTSAPPAATSSGSSAPSTRRSRRSSRPPTPTWRLASSGSSPCCSPVARAACS